MAASREHKRSGSKRRDRISSLSDDVLGHVLSFLPTKEAALCRRWRHVFGSVHTITFEEAEGDRARDWIRWYYEMLERKSCCNKLLDNVGVFVLNKRLRRFAICCCHKVKSVDIDASKLRTLEYRGREPSRPFLSLHGSPTTIPLCTIDFCKPLSEEAEFSKCTRFLKEISNTKHLHLRHGSLHSSFFDAGFPLFSSLTRLTLQGCIGSSNTVVAVGRILEQTPNLEVLSLLMWESQKGKADRRVIVFDEITVPGEPIFSLPCLRIRVREISVEDYEGNVQEKMLVKLLLRNAVVLERLQVVFTEGLSSRRKNRLEVQMGKWGVANSEKVFM